MNIERANELLSRFTGVLSLEFASHPPGWAYSLRLKLADHADDTARLVLICDDVSQLQLSGFGGGYTQVQCLRIRGIVHHQLDRARYVIENLVEVEGTSFSFVCNTFQIEAR